MASEDDRRLTELWGWRDDFMREWRDLGREHEWLKTHMEMVEQATKELSATMERAAKADEIAQAVSAAIGHHRGAQWTVLQRIAAAVGGSVVFAGSLLALLRTAGLIG